MRGIVFLGERELEIQNFPDPTPGAGEAVLELRASGMCGSDLKFYRASKDGGTAALHEIRDAGWTRPGRLAEAAEPQIDRLAGDYLSASHP